MSLRSEIESLKRYAPVCYGWAAGPREAMMAEVQGAGYVDIEDVLLVVDGMTRFEPEGPGIPIMVEQDGGLWIKIDEDHSAEQAGKKEP